jgi:exopolyphosphatase / guanosine-5'-triphosphate,3'-diphosphate pyrophosphatase
MTSPNPCVAVIDIGSNSIKALVARQSTEGQIITLLAHTIEARISAGISQTPPRLSRVGMQNGVEAITELLALISPYQPLRIMAVATSAVRDAVNGADFQRLVQSATGHQLRILNGREEANLIGRGLLCDPDLPTAADFYVFDLGGGSMECLAFSQGMFQNGISLQLGCVRLTERFITNPHASISPESISAISAHTAATLAQSPFGFTLPGRVLTIGTGGTFATARNIFAAKAGIHIESASPVITVVQLRALMIEVSAMELDARQKIPGLPKGRADVFPAALATLLAVAEAGEITAFHHSFYNLRCGIAAELLAV